MKILSFLLIAVKYFYKIVSAIRVRRKSAMSDWTFLNNHALVLSFLSKHPLITAREVARSIGITERAVRTIIADLDDAGYIDRKKQGRRVIYSINPRLSLRHHTQREINIGNFLEVLGWEGIRKRS
jgi:DNA-binding transcriptional ArsR family regulator